MLRRTVVTNEYSVDMSLETLAHEVCTHISQLFHDTQLTSKVCPLSSSLKHIPQTSVSVLYSVYWLSMMSSLPGFARPFNPIFLFLCVEKKTWLN